MFIGFIFVQFLENHFYLFCFLCFILQLAFCLGFVFLLVLLLTDFISGSFCLSGCSFVFFASVFVSCVCVCVLFCFPHLYGFFFFFNLLYNYFVNFTEVFTEVSAKVLPSQETLLYFKTLPSMTFFEPLFSFIFKYFFSYDTTLYIFICLLSIYPMV